MLRCAFPCLLPLTLVSVPCDQPQVLSHDKITLLAMRWPPHTPSKRRPAAAPASAPTVFVRTRDMVTAITQWQAWRHTVVFIHRCPTRRCIVLSMDMPKVAHHGVPVEIQLPVSHSHTATNLMLPANEGQRVVGRAILRQRVFLHMMCALSTAPTDAWEVKCVPRGLLCTKVNDDTVCLPFAAQRVRLRRDATPAVHIKVGHLRKFLHTIRGGSHVAVHVTPHRPLMIEVASKGMGCMQLYNAPLTL